MAPCGSSSDDDRNIKLIIQGFFTASRRYVGLCWCGVCRRICRDRGIGRGVGRRACHGQRHQLAHLVPSITRARRDIVLVSLGAQLVEDARHGLRLGRDGLVSLTAALVLLLKRPDDPELAYAASQREQVLDALDLETDLAEVVSMQEKRITYEGLGFQLHGHAVVGSLADGDLVGNALSREEDELTVGLEDLGDGLSLPV